jgi:membrane-bound metal-dependent hydrolase YbcI (DUF457 family)
MPLAHSLAGYCVYKGQRLLFFEKPWQSALFFVALAILPDADFLPGFFMGNPNLWHQTVTHSLGATLLVGAIGTFYFGRKDRRYIAYFAAISLAYFSHIFLDYFNQDMRAPYGVMLFWPLSSEHFTSPISLFVAVHKSSDSGTFFQSLWHPRNLLGLSRELVVMGPLALMFWLVHRKRNRKSSLEGGQRGVS